MVKNSILPITEIKQTKINLTIHKFSVNIKEKKVGVAGF